MNVDRRNRCLKVTRQFLLLQFIGINYWERYQFIGRNGMILYINRELSSVIAGNMKNLIPGAIDFNPESRKKTVCLHEKYLLI
ncbi:MAG: hypothetical protein ABI416_16815 [Ginsengibacter sp.]